MIALAKRCEMYMLLLC